MAGSLAAAGRSASAPSPSREREGPGEGLLRPSSSAQAAPAGVIRFPVETMDPLVEPLSAFAARAATAYG